MCKNFFPVCDAKFFQFESEKSWMNSKFDMCHTRGPEGNNQQLLHVTSAAVLEVCSSIFIHCSIWTYAYVKVDQVVLILTSQFGGIEVTACQSFAYVNSMTKLQGLE